MKSNKLLVLFVCLVYVQLYHLYPQVLGVHTMYFKFLLNKFLFNCFFFFGLQVAVIAGNLDLANVIQRHKPDDVGKFFLILYSFAVWTF